MGKMQANESPDDVTAIRGSSTADDIYQGQSSKRVVLLLVSVFMSMFLVALDRTVISTVCVHSVDGSSPPAGFVYSSARRCANIV